MLHAHIHIQGVLGSIPMVPKAPVTHCIGEETRKTIKQKGTKSKGRPPFCQLQCYVHRGPSACCASRTQCLVIPPDSHDLDKISDDECGPSVPRTHVFACPVAAPGSFAVCACRCALPPTVSPLGRAPCSVALPSLAGWSTCSRSAQNRWLPGKVRARRTVCRSGEYSARSRCYSEHTIGGNIEEQQRQKEQ